MPSTSSRGGFVPLPMLTFVVSVLAKVSFAILNKAWAKGKRVSKRALLESAITSVTILSKPNLDKAVEAHWAYRLESSE